MKIFSWLEFTKESVDVKSRIEISDKLKNVLKIVNTKLSSFILSFENISADNLIESPLNYLDVNDKGEISYIPTRYVEESVDPYTSPRRQDAKISKIVSKIIKKEYFDENIIQKDLEEFSNKWKSLFDDEIHVEIYRGDKCLEAFGYNDSIDMSRFSSSCANFNQHLSKGYSYAEPGVSWFDIYTKNPKNIGVVVALKNGKVRGRRPLIEGEQVETHGYYKKGEHYGLLNNYYGEGGSGSIFDNKIKEYAKNKIKNCTTVGSLPDGSSRRGIDVFITQLEDTRFPQYCPFDGFYVNFELNQISYTYPMDSKNMKLPGWINAYKAQYIK